MCVCEGLFGRGGGATGFSGVVGWYTELEVRAGKGGGGVGGSCFTIQGAA